MADPVIFQSTTARNKLPLLYAGQAQKEFYVNEAHALLDALVQSAVEGESDTPPASPQEGQCWVVSGPGQGAWSGLDDKLVCYIGGTWKALDPISGMRVYNRASGQMLLYDGGWQRAVEPPAPTGGATVDSEARATMTQLIDALKVIGIFARA